MNMTKITLVKNTANFNVLEAKNHSPNDMLFSLVIRFVTKIYWTDPFRINFFLNTGNILFHVVSFTLKPFLNIDQLNSCINFVRFNKFTHINALHNRLNTKHKISITAFVQIAVVNKYFYSFTYPDVNVLPL